MQYEPLKSLYHAYRSAEYSAEVEKRRNSYSTLDFSINIKDFKTHVEHPAFLVCDWEMLCLMETIASHTMHINSLFIKLPQVARDYYVKKCLVDEIQMTNDIEGIHSTRKEINETIDTINKDDRQKKRFSGMIKKYDIMLKNKESDIPIFTSTDVRKLYDEIVMDEVHSKDFPDGMIFRKDTVFVASKTGQERHEGVFPESKIIEYMERSLDILQDDNIPLLVRVGIFHYLFGYIHPFYDGNGRMNRFISSYVLFKEYNALVGLSISRILKENREAYYRSFRICNDGKNAGDITPFVISFLSFIEKAAESVREQLTIGISQINYYQSMILQNINMMECKTDREIKNTHSLLMLFVQNALFADDPFTITDLANYANMSETTLRKELTKLTDVVGIPIIIEKGKRPIHMKIDLDRFDAFLKELNDKNDQTS